MIVNGERELAYVVTIDAIEPIVGSDNCECAVVGGWRVMVKKNQFHAGELAVYFEIDSKVDTSKPAFAFLEKKHGAIKTQKYTFGGKGNFISQGLIMSFADLGIEPCACDTCLTKELGVTYYVAADNARKAKVDPEAKYKSMCGRHPKLFKNKVIRKIYKTYWGKKILYFFLGKKKDNVATHFPSQFKYISKSDEERIENMTWVLTDKSPYVQTTKIDGTSTLFLLVRKKIGKNEYYVCSRNVRQLDEKQVTFFEENVYWQANNKYCVHEALEDLLAKHPDWKYVAIQGETAGVSLGGAKIQGNPHQFTELRFFAYNFIDSEHGRWNSVEGKALLEHYNIEWVPIVNENYILPDDLEEFKLSADGECEAPGATGAREGYVYRNVADPYKSFKNVSREYLLNH